MKAHLVITLKSEVLDPQGQAVTKALSALGFGGVRQVRQGKFLEIDLKQTDPEKAKTLVQDMCKKLLVNDVIEEYRVEILPHP